MAERERGKDRVTPGQHSNTSSGVWNTLFGKRSAAAPTTSKAHATSESRGREREREREVYVDTGRRGSIVDEVFSPKSGDEGRRGASPARGVFNLEAALELMQNGEEKGQVLGEVMRATAVWLGLNEEGKAVIKPEDVRVLYDKAVQHADAMETTPRSSALALLSQMIKLYPPVKSILDANPQTTLTRRTVYRTIRGSDSSDCSVIYAQVVALRSLTKEGVEMDEFDGIVGWLVRMVRQVNEEWTSWCSKKQDTSMIVDQKITVS
jgi:hypothetical protein